MPGRRASASRMAWSASPGRSPICRTVTVLAALLGLVHGYLNGTGMGLSAQAIIAVLGLASAVFVLVALVAAFVVRLRAPWTRIAVRVGGSWIAASGLLMLGWSMRGF